MGEGTGKEPCGLCVCCPLWKTTENGDRGWRMGTGAGGVGTGPHGLSAPPRAGSAPGFACALAPPRPRLCPRSGSAPSPTPPHSLCSVTPMSSSQVRTSDAYLLFYELASPPSRM